MTLIDLTHTRELAADPASVVASVVVAPGPLLLAGATDGGSLEAHRSRRGTLPPLDLATLLARSRALDLRGRGGAGFPFARKLETAAGARGRPVVVVNFSEGEPGSHKDAALARVAPHLVLDGAAVTARALGAREVHVVTGADSPTGETSLRVAVRERRTARDAADGRLRHRFHRAEARFVSGQSAAVLELLAGRPGLPVTTWQPSATSGHRGAPTVLSNAETFAVVGLLALGGTTLLGSAGTEEEPGTTLLTVDGDGQARGQAPRVVEVPFGTPWTEVLPASRLQAPILLGGYHGAWAAPGALLGLTVSPRQLTEVGLGLGAGVVLPLDHGCPLTRTSALVDHLARESAGRCGPCRLGLPALADELRRVAAGQARGDEVDRLTALVTGRGACAHPDGTARLVRSVLTTFPTEVLAHAQGVCPGGRP